MDAINVFPVADGDTGTNLHRTLDAANRALEARPEGGSGAAASPVPSSVAPPASEDHAASAASVLKVLAQGALLGACGNSGTILAQLLRGMADGLGADGGAEPGAHAGGRALARALRRAHEAAYAAVARPVEGTMLTVSRAAASAAESAASAEPGASDAASVARAAHEAAVEALSATTGQLAALREAGVVDAGGGGLVAVLGALAEVLDGTGELASASPADAAPGYGALGGAVQRGPRPCGEPAPGECGATPDTYAHDCGPGLPDSGPAYEVTYLLEADAAALSTLKGQLDALGDSLVVGGGDGLFSVHVHVDDAGAAVEAGMAAGRPYRVRIDSLVPGPRSASDPPGDAPRGRAVVAVVAGDGLAALCEEAGATVVRVPESGDAVDDGDAADAGGAVESAELLAAVHGTGAAEVVLLPNDRALEGRSGEVARAAERAGRRVAVVPARAAVQGLAALAVHDPQRRFEEDVVAMTAAARATRYGELAVAARESWTTAGVCRAGDVLGVIDGDVAVIGRDLAATAAEVVDRMLAAGGELVTLVPGAEAPEGLAEELRERACRGRLGVEAEVYEGRQRSAVLLIGVE